MVLKSQRDLTTSLFNWKKQVTKAINELEINKLDVLSLEEDRVGHCSQGMINTLIQFIPTER